MPGSRHAQRLQCAIDAINASSPYMFIKDRASAILLAIDQFDAANTPPEPQQAQDKVSTMQISPAEGLAIVDQAARDAERRRKESFAKNMDEDEPVLPCNIEWDVSGYYKFVHERTVLRPHDLRTLFEFNEYRERKAEAERVNGVTGAMFDAAAKHAHHIEMATPMGLEKRKVVFCADLYKAIESALAARGGK